MSLQNKNPNSSAPHKPKRSKLAQGSVLDFCKIGGLSNHLKTLREIIIFPLLHSNIYTHFNIKAPRGVLFHGPPGTGKTLVAAALATEINKEGIGKVAFFARKGADVLDKWVGGSEKNLRDLFDKATKAKPSIIFFDELDGLAPVRDRQMDQIHSSVVATLLALMDGLDNKPGVIVIGATNRIEAIDPALRRPGRFDKELYFPLPGSQSRKEILEVHTMSWKHKPSPRLINTLVESTPGFSGADLQALCADAIVRCMKRVYPGVHDRAGVKIEPEKLRVEECDFLNARMTIVPSTQKAGLIMRKLTTTIRPLLEGQLTKITTSIQRIWPHFLEENFKYFIGEERYAGRVLLIGSSMQGVYSHLIPALLQRLEYLPVFLYDVTNIFKKNFFFNVVHNPCVFLLSRVDEWWGIISDCEQLSILSTLEDIHAGLPILVIATCKSDIPPTLQHFFYNHSSILLKIDDPTDEERLAFLKPLFFDRNVVSLIAVLENCRKNLSKGCKKIRGKKAGRGIKAKRRRDSPSQMVVVAKRPKLQGPSNHLKLARSSSCNNIFDMRREIEHSKRCELNIKKCDSYDSFETCEDTPYFSGVLSSLIKQEDQTDNQTSTSLRAFLSSKRYHSQEGKEDGDERFAIEKIDPQMQNVTRLWKHAALNTSRNMSVSQLELLYDVISACISIHWNSFESSIENLEGILQNIELEYIHTSRASED